MINRISLNGKRYVADKSYLVMVSYCNRHQIPERFIREQKKGFMKGYYYLRLWGRYKKRK